MKRIFWLPLLLVLVMGLILSGCSGSNSTPTQSPAATPTSSSIATAPSSPAASAEEITIKFASFVPETDLNNVATKWLVDEVNKTAGSKVVIKGYYSASLVKANDQFSAIQNGLADMAWITPSYTPADLPLWTLPNSLPLMTFDMGARAASMNDYYNNYQPAKSEMDKFKVEYIGAFPTDSYLMIGNKRIQTIADIKGVPYRTFGLLANSWNALGGVPVTMTAPEVYDGMQKGTIQGALGSVTSHIMSMKYYEVAKYLTTPGFGAMGVPLIMSKTKWDTLPSNVQQAFIKVAQQDLPEWYYNTGTAQISQAFETMKNKGITIDAMSDADVDSMISIAGKPIWDSQAKALADKGLPGQEAIDFMLNSIAQYEAAHPRK